jgi:flagellar assembly protein FliH
MLQSTGPKISRMKYRPVHSIVPALADPKPLFLTAESSFRPPTDSREEQEALKVRIEELEQQISEQQREFVQQMEAARKAAFEEGREAEASLRASSIQKVVTMLSGALEDFRNARDGYLAQVEREVVHLALAIAERVLRREAQMDPLLLAGAVRVALGQLSETTEVRMRVPAAEYELWGEMINLMPGLPLRPQLISDNSLQAGECFLETALGSVELGVKSQLAEIERGFFDLLEHRSRLKAV